MARSLLLMLPLGGKMPTMLIGVWVGRPEIKRQPSSPLRSPTESAGEAAPMASRTPLVAVAVSSSAVAAAPAVPASQKYQTEQERPYTSNTERIQRSHRQRQERWPQSHP